MKDDAAKALFRLVRLQSLARQQWSRAEGLSLIEYSVIEAVGTWPGSTPSIIATTLGLPRNLMSTLVTALCESGLISRVRDPQDARRARLYLTNDGHRVRAACQKAWGRILQSLGEGS